MKQRQLNTTSIYRRLSLVGLSVALLIIVLKMWVESATVGEQTQLRNFSEHTRLMLKQSAQVAQKQLKAKKLEQLQQMLDDLATDPYITQSRVYDKTGKLIAKSQNAVSAKEIYLQQRTLADTLPPYDAGAEPPANLDITMYVSEMMDGDKLIGYLHVGYLQQQALTEPLSLYQTNMQRMLLMMLLSGVIGFMLTRGFARFSRNSYRIVDKG